MNTETVSLIVGSYGDNLVDIASSTIDFAHHHSIKRGIYYPLDFNQVIFRFLVMCQFESFITKYADVSVAASNLGYSADIVRYISESKSHSLLVPQYVIVPVFLSQIQMFQGCTIPDLPQSG